MPKRRIKRMQQGGLPGYDEYGQTDHILENGADGWLPDSEIDYSDPEYEEGGYEDHSGGIQQEDAYSNDNSAVAHGLLESRRRAAIDQLNAARDRIISSLRPQHDPRAKYLAMAGAFLSPTRTGSFGESAGMAATAAAPHIQRQSDLDYEYAAKLANMDYEQAVAEYQRSMKDPSYTWTVGPNGLRQQAMIVDGQLVPIGREMAPTRGSRQTASERIEDLVKSGISRERAEASVLGENRGIQVNVQGQSFEKQNEKNAADAFAADMEEYKKKRKLISTLSAMEKAIDETPDVYFGPAGPGLKFIAQGLKQIGFDVGEGLDQAELIVALQSNLGPAQRIQGSGASSDKDVQLFMNSLPNLANSKEGNKLIIKFYKKLDAYNRKIMEIARAAHDRGDFWGLDAMSAEEIEQAGRILTDEEYAEMERVAAQGRISTSPGVNIQETDDEIRINQ